MMMTLKEVRPTVVEGQGYKRECRAHNPAKESLLELVRLALLARFVLAHGQYIGSRWENKTEG